MRIKFMDRFCQFDDEEEDEDLEILSVQELSRDCNLVLRSAADETENVTEHDGIFVLSERVTKDDTETETAIKYVDNSVNIELSQKNEISEEEEDEENGEENGSPPQMKYDQIKNERDEMENHEFMAAPAVSLSPIPSSFTRHDLTSNAIVSIMGQNA